jgi:predicted XRE-type DNA-binding protein
LLNKRALLLLSFTTANAIVWRMWKDIIAAIMKSGLSQHQIAAAVGVSQAHISDLAAGKRGKRIGFELGKRLQSLHEERCGAEAQVAD